MSNAIDLQLPYICLTKIWTFKNKMPCLKFMEYISYYDFAQCCLILFTNCMQVVTNNYNVIRVDFVINLIKFQLGFNFLCKFEI
jgi:hypothetical protein